MKGQWITFCDYYVINSDHIDAYMKAYPKCNNRANASKKGLELLKKPQIKVYLDEAFARKKIIVDGARDQALKEAAQKNVLSEIEVDSILCKIIDGKHTAKKIFIINRKPVKVDVTPDIGEQLDAIDKYYKRFGSYAPEKKQDVADPLAAKTNDELKASLNELRNILNQ